MKAEAIANAVSLSTALSKAMQKEGAVGLTEEEIRAKCVEIAIQIAPEKTAKSVLDTAAELASYIFSGYTTAEIEKQVAIDKDKVMPLADGSICGAPGSLERREHHPPNP